MCLLLFIWCVCVFVCMCLSGSLPYFECTNIFCHYVWWTVVSLLYTLHVSMCKKAAASIIFSYFFWRKKTEKRKNIIKCSLRSRGAGNFLMSWYGYVGFSFVSSIFVQKPEQQLLMGPLSRHRLDGVQTWSWWLLPPHLHPSSGLLRGRPLEVPDLFDQVSLFIIELFILRSVVLELAEKLNEFGLVLQQDVEYGLRLVGVGHKHLMVEEDNNDVNVYRLCTAFNVDHIFEFLP